MAATHCAGTLRPHVVATCCLCMAYHRVNHSFTNPQRYDKPNGLKPPWQPITLTLSKSTQQCYCTSLQVPNNARVKHPMHMSTLNNIIDSTLHLFNVSAASLGLSDYKCDCPATATTTCSTCLLVLHVEPKQLQHSTAQQCLVSICCSWQVVDVLLLQQLHNLLGPT